jgi:hypothetical protein
LQRLELGVSAEGALHQARYLAQRRRIDDRARQHQRHLRIEIERVSQIHLRQRARALELHTSRLELRHLQVRG